MKFSGSLILKYQRSNSHPNIVQVVLRHPLVIDCAVVGVSDKLKGQMPLGLVVTKGEVGLEILGGEEHHQRSLPTHEGETEDLQTEHGEEECNTLLTRDWPCSRVIVVVGRGGVTRVIT